jgi:hypothetical protein
MYNSFLPAFGNLPAQQGQAMKYSGKVEPNEVNMSGTALISVVASKGVALKKTNDPLYDRINSLNSNLSATALISYGKTYKYILFQGITESEILLVKSIPRNLQDSLTLNLVAFGVQLTTNSTTYPKQVGLSDILLYAYTNAETKAALENQGVFVPFSPENFSQDGMNLNEFVDNYTALTRVVNVNTTDKEKTYSMLFQIRSSNADISGSGYKSSLLSIGSS